MKKGRATPDFIGIGFRRCATSWLNVMLAEHPGVGKPRGGIHFFNRHFDRGREWYEGTLSGYIECTVEVLGEFSTTYSYPEYAEDVARRVADLYPETSILATIRNPVDRAYSDYLRGRAGGEIECSSFSEAVVRHPELIDRGRYGRLLEHFYHNFDAGKILVIRYDDIIAHPEAVLERVYSFIGVDPRYTPDGAAHALGATYVPKSVRLERALRLVQRVGRVWKQRLPGFRWLGEQGYHRALVNHLRKLNERVEGVSTAEERRIELVRRFEDDIRHTMVLSGLDLRPWIEQDGGIG